MPRYSMTSGPDLFLPAEEHIRQDFELAYCLLRKKEGRMYSDEELARLPEINAGHPHAAEWKIRKASASRLLHYLESKKQNIHILEIGCGNGWLSYQMSRIPGCRVVGLDINLTELQQATRVFGNSSKLKFIFGDIRRQVMEDLKFDIVVFAASIQYFPSCPEIVRLIQGRLNKGGEIHILDSILYEDGQLQAARKRSSDYFLSMGQPEMASYYFHHGVDGLMSLNSRILRDPRTMRNRLFSKNPFFWVCIHKEMIG